MPWIGSKAFAFTEVSFGANAPDSPGVFGLYREGSPRWMFFGEDESLRQELLKHLHNEYYRFAREVAPTHCYEEIADAAARVARRESLVNEFLSDRFNAGAQR
jgi:hypothetical protein